MRTPGMLPPLFPRRALLKGTVAVESTVRHTGDRFIGAGDESVENRQYATEGLLLQIDFHVFGDEVGRRERGLHCVLQVSECAGEVCDAQRIRRRTHRFLPAKDVHRGTRKKLIDVEKIGTTKHIERDRNRLRCLWKISALPRVQLLKLAQVEVG